MSLQIQYQDFPVFAKSTSVFLNDVYKNEETIRKLIRYV